MITGATSARERSARAEEARGGARTSSRRGTRSPRGTAACCAVKDQFVCCRGMFVVSLCAICLACVCACFGMCGGICGSRLLLLFVARAYYSLTQSPIDLFCSGCLTTGTSQEQQWQQQRHFPLRAHVVTSIRSGRRLSWISGLHTDLYILFDYFFNLNLL